MHLSAHVKRILATVYFPLSVAYVVLSYIYPTDPVTMIDRHWSYSQARIIALTFAAVYIVIWHFAYFAASELIAYSHSIKQYKDGEAFSLLASALFLIAVYLPFRCLSKISLNYAAHLHPSFTSTSNMIISYINVLFPLAIYAYISMGGSRLFRMVRAKVPFGHVCILALILCTLAATYCYAAFSTSVKLTPSDWMVPINYDIVAPLRILTIVVPYLFMWVIGFIAVYQIYFYQQHVQGIIYKNSLKLLSTGLTMVIVTTVTVQYITVAAARIGHLPTQVTISLSLSIMAGVLLACVLIVKGVNRLRIFEELM